MAVSSGEPFWLLCAIRRVMLLAAFLSAYRTKINGSALCAALAFTERD
jgi:hypothetical protein